MSISRLTRFPAPKSSRGGFTLVELLVVIGIIAILAGVALGPITKGIQKAKQSGGMQTARTIALAEFQFSVDNDGSYPDKNYVASGGGTGDASDIAKCLLSGNYISDATIFFIKGSNDTQYTGTAPSTAIAKTNISWDFAGATNFNGVNSNTPDQMPIVWSCSGADPSFTAGGKEIDVTTKNTLPFGEQGLAICYKSNSAKFQVVKNDGSFTVEMVDATYPGWSTYSYLPGGG